MRILLRVLSPLLALAVVAVGALLTIEVLAAWGGTVDSALIVDWPAWRDGAERLTWRDASVRWTAAAVAAAGAAMVAIALAARRQDLELAGPSADVTVTTSARVLARLLRQRLGSVAEVSGVSVRASRRVITVRARALAEPADAVVPVLRDHVGGVLAALRPVRPPKVSVHVDPPRGGAAPAVESVPTDSPRGAQ